MKPSDETALADEADHRWQRHEILLSLLGVLTVLALAIRVGPANMATIYCAVTTTAFCLIVASTRRHSHHVVQKYRFITAFLYVLWFYKAIEIIVPALGNPPHDGVLLDVDQTLFGVTPSVPVQAWTTTWANELLSGCYLMYLVYLHACVIHSWYMPLNFTRQFANWMYSVYAIGLAGYLLYPAIGPENAFRELYGPDLEGPLITPLNRWIVNSGSSVYDAFPSLHVLVTLSLLEFDRQRVRRRFYWMILPVVGIVASTIYLRYHYAVDLIAGGLLFVAARGCFREKEIADVETGDGDQ